MGRRYVIGKQMDNLKVLEDLQTDALKDFASDPPGSIYHYLSSNSLLGVVESKRFWATSIHYLNDFYEYNYAIDLVHDILHHDISPRTEVERGLIQSIIKHLDSIRTHTVYVSCFSEEKDLLSQWRAYCPPEGGYCVGFNTEHIRSIAEKSNFTLIRCVYDVVQQRQYITDIILETLNSYDPTSDNEAFNNEFSTSWYFISMLMVLIPVFKHPAFHEEKEWRLVSPLLTSKQLPIKYRSNKAILVPYVEAEISDDSGVLNIEEVIVGPNKDINLASSSINSFSESIEHLNVGRVTLSGVPYRSM